jgi:hypothetical protein
VAVDRLLHAASCLVDDLAAELHDVERVKHRDRVFELVVDGVLVAMEGSSVATSTRRRNASPRCSSQSA